MVYRFTSYFGGPICFILCFGRIFHPSFVPFNPYLIYYIVVSHKKKKIVLRSTKVHMVYTTIAKKRPKKGWKNKKYSSPSNRAHPINEIK